MPQLLNILLSAGIITGAAWLAKRNPSLAGFIIALPLATLITLPLAHFQSSDPVNSVAFAKSIFVAVPISLLFFVPFLLSDKLKLDFWVCYGVGLVLLAAGYFVHRYVTNWLSA